MIVTMSGDTARVPGQPKLRASCDACGQAKLKCDRSHPTCGRCLTYGMQCLYGVSRKMGKPRRDRIRPSTSATPTTPSSAATTAPVPTAVPISASKNIRKVNSSAEHGSHLPERHSSSLSTDPAPLSTTWDGMDQRCNDLMIGLDPFDEQRASMLNFSALDFADRSDLDQHSYDDVLSAGLQFGPMPTPALSEIGSCSPVAATAPQSLSALDQLASCKPERRFNHNDAPQPVGPGDHQCAREAWEIMGSLLFAYHSAASSMSPSVAAAFPTAKDGGCSNSSGASSQLPFDHALQLNRHASERLTRLLDCSCASSPSLVTLYASTISWILLWYQLAVSSIGLDSVPQSPATSSIQRPPQGFGSYHGSASWPSAAGAGGDTFGAAGGSVGSAATMLTAMSSSSSSSMKTTPLPAKMAIGSFDVDDLRVQLALKLQLLLGEMRRAGRLIDQFSAASRHAGIQNFADGRYFAAAAAAAAAAATAKQAPPSPSSSAAGGGADGLLHRGVESWLRGEHSRITEAMRTKLRELDA